MLGPPRRWRGELDLALGPGRARLASGWARFPAVSTEPDAYSPAEVRKMVADGAQLIDVRADHEWEAGRIAGADAYRA